MYRYTLIAKNRGLVLSLGAFSLLGLASVINDLPHGLLSSPISLGGAIIFTCFNLIWDQKIKKNHLDIDLVEDGVVFFIGEMERKIDRRMVEKIEYFPTDKNLYDDDFINNFMSSGIRIWTKENEKFLIFSKIRGFKAVKEQLDQWNIAP